MKYFFIFIVFLFSLSTFTYSNDNTPLIQQEKENCAVENYKICLSHQNTGVVESTLGNIIKFKYRYPEADIACFFKCLDKLSDSFENEKIQKKAQLVSRILQNQDFVNEIGDNFYADVDQFLDIILLSSRFEHSLLTTASQ